jgi:hypothetical protein
MFTEEIVGLIFITLSFISLSRYVGVLIVGNHDYSKWYRNLSIQEKLKTKHDELKRELKVATFALENSEPKVTDVFSANFNWRDFQAGILTAKNPIKNNIGESFINIFMKLFFHVFQTDFMRFFRELEYREALCALKRFENSHPEFKGK